MKVDRIKNETNETNDTIVVVSVKIEDDSGRLFLEDIV
jgi:hypothetical protein